jgi:hypothetical protein
VLSVTLGALGEGENLKATAVTREAGIAERVGDHQSRATLIAMAQSWQHLAA